jgi:hypothetical protein
MSQIIAWYEISAFEVYCTHFVLPAIYSQTTSFADLSALQFRKDWLTQLAVFGPLVKLDLTDQDWIDPVAVFHDRGSALIRPEARLGWSRGLIDRRPLWH